MSFKSQYIPNVKSYNRFPGPMPVALCRDHLKNLQGREYYVSEKVRLVLCLCLTFVKQTDGTRYMLYSSKTAAYLIDRKFKFYPITHFFGNICGVLAERGDTLLDGELIRRHGTKEFYYMVRLFIRPRLTLVFLDL